MTPPWRGLGNVVHDRDAARLRHVQLDDVDRGQRLLRPFGVRGSPSLAPTLNALIGLQAQPQAVEAGPDLAAPAAVASGFKGRRNVVSIELDNFQSDILLVAGGRSTNRTAPMNATMADGPAAPIISSP